MRMPMPDRDGWLELVAMALDLGDAGVRDPWRLTWRTHCVNVAAELRRPRVAEVLGDLEDEAWRRAVRALIEDVEESMGVQR